MMIEEDVKLHLSTPETLELSATKSYLRYAFSTTAFYFCLAKKQQRQNKKGTQYKSILLFLLIGASYETSGVSSYLFFLQFVNC